MEADINFSFDAVCPFAWMTSKRVQAQRDYTVDRRFVSLRRVSAEVEASAERGRELAWDAADRTGS